MYYTKLLERFPYSLSESLLAKLEALPSVVKPLGLPAPSRPDLHWMEYENHSKCKLPWFEGKSAGTIAVTQNTYEYLPHEVNFIVHALWHHLPGIPWKHSNVSFMKTQGDVLPHRGGTRSASLNIGLLNSNSASTHVAKNNLDSDYDPQNLNLASYTVEDREIYLLNVLHLHSVTSSDPKAIRYQITYSLEDNYETVLTKLRPGL